MNGVQSQAYTWVVNLQAPFQLSFVCPWMIDSPLHEQNPPPQPWVKASLYRASRPTNHEIIVDLDRYSKQAKTTPMQALNPKRISRSWDPWIVDLSPRAVSRFPSVNRARESSVSRYPKGDTARARVTRKRKARGSLLMSQWWGVRWFWWSGFNPKGSSKWLMMSTRVLWHILPSLVTSYQV